MSGHSHTQVWLPGPEATDALGVALAATQPSAAVVYLSGDLGAGKSTLARAWLRALGVQGTIRSPTYTLVERYPLPVRENLMDHPVGGPSEALHLDLYRIGEPGELEYLGLDDVEQALWLIEWPERGARALPPADLSVVLALVGEGREAGLEAGSEAGRDWLARISDAIDLMPELRQQAEP